MVSDLAKDSDEQTYQYQSTGVRKAVEPLRLDKGHAFKGHLYFTAEFLPAYKLKWHKFDAPANEIVRSVSEDDTESVDNNTSDDGEAAPADVTIQMSKDTHTKGAKLTDITKTTETKAIVESDLLKPNANITSHDEDHANDGTDLSIEDLLTHRMSFFLLAYKCLTTSHRVWHNHFQCHLWDVT